MVIERQRISLKRPGVRVTVVLAVVALLVVSSVSVYYYLPKSHCDRTGVTIPSPEFYFDLNGALQFYQTLKTPLGLETDQPGSNSIWLADDQALDYNALQRIYGVTCNSTAQATADGIKKAMQQWGGLYHYWNTVFEVVGNYPNSTAVMENENVTVNSDYQGYNISTTEYYVNPNFNYSAYANELAYRVLLDLHLNNASAAESSFASLSGMFDGSGFRDAAYNGTYQSYKLAVYVIVWRQLMSANATEQFASEYAGTVNSVVGLMSMLQAPDGGVWTGYQVSNGVLNYGSTISGENGETTSLFVIAYST